MNVLLDIKKLEFQISMSCTNTNFLVAEKLERTLNELYHIPL